MSKQESSSPICDLNYNYLRLSGVFMLNIDVSRIRTAFTLMQSTWTLESNHKPEHAVGLKWALVTPE